MAMGGVGEAMLLGAAMGGGSAALTGGDPLKGALLGGLTGGIGGGASTLAANTAANAGTSALTAAGTEAATSAAMANALPASTMAATPMAATGLPAGQSFAQASQLANTAAANQAVTGAMNQALPLSANAGISSLPAASVAPAASAAPATGGTFGEGMARFASNPMASIKANPFIAGSAAIQGAIGSQEGPQGPEEYDGPLKRYKFDPTYYRPAMFAEGGIANLAAGGYDRMVGEQPMYQALAKGGISDLGGYSDYAGGGRMLKGPGDGMSDSSPASIAGKRPARLARDEFVVPADVVSGLGNGSSDAGAKHLYAMMDRVRQARTGSKKQGKEINARRFMPA
jgi:hypothetical protein